MNEDRWNETLRELAQDYHRPPEPPREAMWAEIQRERADELGRRRARRGLAKPTLWTLWATGIAAALLVGIGLGRLSVRPDSVAVGVETPAAPPAAAGVAYRVATTRHLSQAEALLTSFRSGSQLGQTDREIAGWAGELLTTTRLLLDSPAASDPRTRVLLEDLELILAQISRLNQQDQGGVPRGEVEIVREAIEQGGMLPKLRTAIPAGAFLAETEDD